MSQNSIRIVLVGKTGVGKSATGNTILGGRIFPSEPRATSVTVQCQSQKQIIKGREVLVVDTPGLYDTSLSNDKVVQEIMKCITLAAPGPHVFLLVLSIGRFTEEEQNTVRLIQKVFGTDANKHMIVLFTRADDLEERTIDEYIVEDQQLKQVIKTCEGGYHAFNNREKFGHTQVDELMRKIEVIIKHNQNSYYNYDMFQLANELNNTRKTVKEKDEIIAELENKVKALQKEIDSSYCTIV